MMMMNVPKNKSGKFLNITAATAAIVYTPGYTFATQKRRQAPPVALRLSPTDFPSLKVPNHLSSGMVASP